MSLQVCVYLYIFSHHKQNKTDLLNPTCYFSYCPTLQQIFKRIVNSDQSPIPPFFILCRTNSNPSFCPIGVTEIFLSRSVNSTMLNPMVKFLSFYHVNYNQILTQLINRTCLKYFLLQPLCPTNSLGFFLILLTTTFLSL